MRYLLRIIIFSGFLFFYGCRGLCVQNLYLSTDFDYQLQEIQNALYNVLPKDNTVTYTEVPRGLILSIEEDKFFHSGGYVIKPAGAKILNSIASVLQNYDNNCVIESHTDEILSENAIYKQDWELSIARASSVADYLVRVGKISPHRVFPLGFGEMMPFKENVSEKGFSDRRVDFVIFDYDIRR